MSERSVVRVLAVGFVVMGLVLAGVASVAAESEPVQVQVKSEIYQTTREALLRGEKLLGVESKSQPLVPERVKASEIEIVRRALSDAGAKLLGAPIVTGPSNKRATMSVGTAKSGEQSEETAIEFIPRVNPDKSVTLSFLFSVPQGNTTMAIAAGMKLATGESVLCYDIDEATGAALLVIVTPTVI